MPTEVEALAGSFQEQRSRINYPRPSQHSIIGIGRTPPNFLDWFDDQFSPDPHTDAALSAITIEPLICQLAISPTTSFSIERLKQSQRVLDVGMGKGGLGFFLRRYIGFSGHITGVDVYNYPDGQVAELHDEAVYGDMREDNAC